MAVVQRSDGAQFVVHCYRETLSTANTTLFKQQAYALSEQHGYFARFFPHLGNNVESTFASDAGYLLAESVWQALKKPPHMVYCEKFNDEYFCVLVKDSLIYLEGKFSRNILIEELLRSLCFLNNPLIFLYHGCDFLLSEPITQNQDLPLISYSDTNPPFIDKESLFEKLPLSPEVELLSIQQAINSLQLHKASQQHLWSIGAVIFLIMLSIIYYIGTSPTKPQVPQIHPLQNFYKILSTPEPKAILQALSQNILKLYTLPGWTVSKIQLQGLQITATANSYGGSANDLLAWGNQAGANIQLLNNGAEIQLTLPALIKRMPPSQPTPLKNNVATLIDIFMQLFPQKVVSLGNLEPSSNFNIQTITLQLQTITPDMLVLIGNTLNSLPINIISAELNNQNGLLSGTIIIQLLGN